MKAFQRSSRLIHLEYQSLQSRINLWGHPWDPNACHQCHLKMLLLTFQHSSLWPPQLWQGLRFSWGQHSANTCSKPCWCPCGANPAGRDGLWRPCYHHPDFKRMPQKSLGAPAEIWAGTNCFRKPNLGQCLGNSQTGMTPRMQSQPARASGFCLQPMTIVAQRERGCLDLEDRLLAWCVQMVECGIKE